MIEEFKYLLSGSVYDPHYILNSDFAIEFLSSEAGKKQYGDDACTFMISGHDLWKSRKYPERRVSLFISEVLNEQPVNYGFSGEDLRQILFARETFISLYQQLETVEEGAYRERVINGIKNLLVVTVKAYQSGDMEKFWDMTSKLRHVLIVAKKNAYIYESEYAVISKISDQIYSVLLQRWENSYESSKNRDSRLISNAFWKSSYTGLKPLILYTEYQIVKLEKAFLEDRLEEEYEVLKEELIENGATGVDLDVFFSMKQNFWEQSYRTYKLVEVIYFYARNHTIEYGYPVPKRFIVRLKKALTRLILALSNKILIRECVFAKVNADLGYAEDMASIKMDLYSSLKNNAELLHAFGILSEEEKDKFIREGREKFYGDY